MIIPVTDDEVWIRHFADLPALSLPRGPVLVIAPHPDDETLGAGLLIAALTASGVPVTVVAVTDGENAYETGVRERLELGVTREAEQQQALLELGVKADAIVRLRLTDSGLAQQEQIIVDRLTKLIESGMTLIAPWNGDFHPDHEACARAAEAVARTRKVSLISYFFWTWHRGTPDLLDGLSLRRFDASTDQLAMKAGALCKHCSQLERTDGEPILPERLLQPAHWSFEVFLQHD